MEIKKKFTEMIEDHLCGELNPGEKKLLFDRMRIDGSLKSQYLSMQKIDHAIRKQDVIRLRNKLQQIYNNYQHPGIIRNIFSQKKKKWYYIAASTLLLTAVAVSLVLMNSNVPSKNSGLTFVADTISQIEDQTNYDSQMEKEKGVDSNAANDLSVKAENKTPASKSQEQDNSELLAVNFKPSDYFESLIGATRSESISIISPAPKAQFNPHEQIYFRWEGAVKESLYLIIYNNSEEIISKDTIKQNQYPVKTFYDKGLYYWKLESDEELIYMNKFTVKVK